MAKKRELASYDLGFRPKTYWPINNVVDNLLAQIKEPARRRAIQDALKNGGVLPELLSDPTLSPNIRAYLGMSHRLVGGAFLPDLRPLEVEIASIQIASTNWDTFSLRAQLAPDGGIRYFLFDENGDFGSPYDDEDEAEEGNDEDPGEVVDNDSSFKLWLGESCYEPMTMGEVFDWLAHSGLDALDGAFPCRSRPNGRSS